MDKGFWATFGAIKVGAQCLAGLMSSTYAVPWEGLRDALDELAGIDPVYRTVAEKQDALLAMARLRSRLKVEELRILATSEDIAIETGDRSTASWLATATRDAAGTVRREQRLASALASRWALVAEAFAAGR